MPSTFTTWRGAQGDDVPRLDPKAWGRPHPRDEDPAPVEEPDETASVDPAPEPPTGDPSEGSKEDSFPAEPPAEPQADGGNPVDPDKSDEKVYDPSEHGVKDVNAHLSTVDEAERERILEAEKAGQARKGILEA